MAQFNYNSSVKTYTFEIYRGITYTRSFTYKNPSGEAINLTGKSIVIKFKDFLNTTLVLASDDVDAGQSRVEITDAVNGKFKLVISESDTQSAKLTTSSNQGSWWIELHDGDDIFLIWKDKVKVTDV